MRGKEDRISKAIRIALWESRPHVCGICKKKIDNFSEMHVDHIIPVSKGGETIPENIQLSHSFCNLSKGNRVEKQTDCEILTDCSESFINDWFGNRIPQELFDEAAGKIKDIENFFSDAEPASQLHIAIYISIISSIIDINTIEFLPEDCSSGGVCDYYRDDFVGSKTFSDILTLSPSGYGKTKLIKRLNEFIDDVNHIYGIDINKRYTDKKTILKAATQDDYIFLLKDDINDGIKNKDINVLTKQLVFMDEYKYHYLATDDLIDKSNIMSFKEEAFLSKIGELVDAMNTINRFGLHLLHDYINFTTTNAFCVHAEIGKRFHVFYPFEFIKNDSKLKSKFDSLVVNYASIFAVDSFSSKLEFCLNHDCCDPLLDLRIDYWDFAAANYLVYLSFLNIKKLRITDITTKLDCSKRNHLLM